MEYVDAACRTLKNAEKESVYSVFRTSYEALGDWENGIVAMCGFSPYARKLTDTLLDRGVNPEKLFIFDTEKSPEEYRSVKIYPVSKLDDCGDDALFVICTNPYAGYYADFLRGQGTRRLITYHLLSVCDKRFDYEPERYNSAVFVGRMEYLIQNKEFFCKFLHDLGDDESKKIMSKWILYHLTLDALHCGVKSITPPYFGQTILKPEDYRVFADLGGFNGDTLRDFLSQNIPYDEYWYFEPDEDLYREGVKTSSDPRIRYNNLAIGDSVGTTLFAKTADMTPIGKIIDNSQYSGGESTVSINTLDNISDVLPISRKFTAIKMDVEGAEAAALRGAKRIISEFHPALIVSAEHKPDDIKVLSELILQFFGEYKFHLRCCTDSLFTDLTMYAVTNTN